MSFAPSESIIRDVRETLLSTNNNCIHCRSQIIYPFHVIPTSHAAYPYHTIFSNNTLYSKYHPKCLLNSNSIPMPISNQTRSIIGLSDGLTVPFALTAGLSSLGSSKLVYMGGLAEIVRSIPIPWYLIVTLSARCRRGVDVFGLSEGGGSVLAILDGKSGLYIGMAKGSG